MGALSDQVTTNAILSALAFLAAALATWLTHRTNRAVKPNGETLADLMKKMIELETYTHTRNHDIINGQAALMLFLRQIAVEQGWGAELWPGLTADAVRQLLEQHEAEHPPVPQDSPNPP